MQVQRMAKTCLLYNHYQVKVTVDAGLRESLQAPPRQGHLGQQEPKPMQRAVHLFKQVEGLMCEDVRLLGTKQWKAKPEPLRIRSCWSRSSGRLPVVAAPEKIVPEQMAVPQAKGLRTLADVAFVLKIMELLLPSIQNPQLKLTGIIGNFVETPTTCKSALKTFRRCS